MQQEYIDQALAVADSFYNLGFAQGLAFGIFIAFMLYIKVSDWLGIKMIFNFFVENWFWLILSFLVVDFIVFLLSDKPKIPTAF